MTERSGQWGHLGEYVIALSDCPTLYIAASHEFRKNPDCFHSHPCFFSHWLFSQEHRFQIFPAEDKTFVAEMAIYHRFPLLR